MTDKNPYRTLHARMSPPGAAWDEGFAAGRAAATPDPDATAVLAAVKAIIDEPLDERDGHGPTRTGQFARIDALLRDRPTTAWDEGYAEGFAAGRAAATPDPPDEEFTEAAWGLIANAYGGNWGDAPDAWRGAAQRWRDEYIAGANAHPRPAASPDERLREAAEAAVFACLPVLPITGSQNRGYKVSDAIDPKVIADPQEWADAAHAICELHHVLAAADRGTACTDRENAGVGGAVTRGIVPSGTDDPAAADREKPEER